MKEIRETKGIKEALRMVEAVHAATHPIGEIVGPAGVGKTFAARWMAGKFNGVRIPAWEGMSRYQMATEVARALGVAGPGQVDRLLAGRADPDPDSRRLVVVDEAAKLSWRVLELLRYLADETNLAVVLVGTEMYDRQFVGARTRDLLIQLGSRIGAKRVRLAHMDRAETYTYVLKPRFGELDKDIVTGFWQACRRGNYREADELAEECGRIMATNGMQTLTPAVLELAGKWMANRREVAE